MQTLRAHGIHWILRLLCPIPGALHQLWVLHDEEHFCILCIYVMQLPIRVLLLTSACSLKPIQTA